LKHNFIKSYYINAYGVLFSFYYYNVYIIGNIVSNNNLIYTISYYIYLDNEIGLRTLQSVRIGDFYQILSFENAE